MQAQGVKSVYILNDKEAYGLGVATTTRKAAESLGIKIAGFEAWDPKATSYTSQIQKIKATGADAVFLGGLIDENGAQVIKDKVAVLGPNDGAVKLLAPDGFTKQSTIDESGTAAKGMFLSVAGVPIDAFKGAALDFIDGLQRARSRARRSTRTRSTAARPAQVLLDAIAASDGYAGRRDHEDVRRRASRTACSARSRSTRTATPRTPRARSSASRSTRPPTSSTTETTVSPKPETVAAAGGQ